MMRTKTTDTIIVKKTSFYILTRPKNDRKKLFNGFDTNKNYIGVNYERPLRIISVNYGIDDTITFDDYEGKTRTKRVYYAGERPYFIFNGKRVHLDNCYRINQ